MVFKRRECARRMFEIHNAPVIAEANEGTFGGWLADRPLTAYRATSKAPLPTAPSRGHLEFRPMEAKSQRPTQGRDGILSSLNMTIGTLNLAKGQRV